MKLIVLALGLSSMFAANAGPWVTVKADHPSNLYASGETARIKINTELKQGLLSVWVDDGWTNIVAKRTIDLARERSVELSLKRDTPGTLRLYVKGPRKLMKKDRLVFDRDKILPFTPCPADFWTFWQSERARLDREVPINIRLSPTPKLSTRDHDVSYVSFATFNGRRIYALLAIPKPGTDPKSVGTDPKSLGTDPKSVGTDPKSLGTDPKSVGTDPRNVGTDPKRMGTGPKTMGTDPRTMGTDPGKMGTGPYPVCINVPGAGPGAIAPNPLRKGWITLTCNIHGVPIGATRTEHNKRFGAWFKEITKRTGEPTYQRSGFGYGRTDHFYHDAMLGIARAIDWLAQDPRTDERRFVYYGCSQGGGYGLYLTALWGRFAKSLILCPAMCDMLAFRHGREPGSEHIKDQNPPHKAVALVNGPYYDGCNFARQIHTPVRIVSGLGDDDCQCGGVISAFNVIPASDKELRTLPGVGHGWHHGGLESWVFDLPAPGAKSSTTNPR